MRKRSNIDSKFLGKCPICNTKFASSGVSTLEKNGDLQTLYAECEKCGSSVVLGVLRSGHGLVTTVGMLTDMIREDIVRMAGLPPLTSDDVLEAHTYFEKNDKP